MAPLVQLSKTLSELYALDGGDVNDIALVYAFPNPTRLTASLPASTKYAYQGPRTVKLSDDCMARICLGCLAQYYGFVSGPMDLYLFDMDKTKWETAWENLSWTKQTPTHRVDADRVFQAIEPSQRPQVHFVQTAQQVVDLPQKKAVITPMDFLDGQRLLVDQEAHWEMLSKRSLALSNIPSPQTQVIDTILQPEQIGDTDVLSSEIARMLQPVERNPVPFVVKLPLGMGGHAVFMVRDEHQRKDCLAVLNAQLPLMFQSLTRENKDRNPVSLLIQRVVPGDSAGVSVFITRTGRVVFVSCSEQILDERNYWSGGYMDFTRQEVLEKQYKDIVLRVAEYVYSRGYHGPMGIDVMTNEDGEQLVVDMNIRQTGSYTLGLMKRHFWENLKLPLGGLICPFAVRGDRDEFERQFVREIEEGSLVIAAWCRGRGGPGGMFVYSICGLLLGGKDRESLDSLMDRLNKIRLSR